MDDDDKDGKLEANLKNPLSGIKEVLLHYT